MIQLFSYGFNDLAEEILPSVNELDKLGPELLVIAGRRLQQFVSSSTELGECVAALSPQLTQYLDSIVSSNSTE